MTAHGRGATSTARPARTRGPGAPARVRRQGASGGAHDLGTPAWAALVLGLLATCDGGRCDPHPGGAGAAREQAARATPGPREARILRSPLDAKDTSEAKQRFVDLLRRKLNYAVREPAHQWDFWSEGSTRYPLSDKEKAYLMSFRRQTAAGQEGFLVIGTISGQNTVVHGYWRAPAGIDDIHVMDMGRAGKMIYTVSFDTTGLRRTIYHHLLRHGGHHITPVWSYRLGYEVDHPKTYKPVSVSFRDMDKDGIPEVRVRLPGADTPRLWKRRWAIFKWDAPQNEFLPLRGLAFTNVALQRPRWAVFGFLEALRTGAPEDARRFGTDLRSCRPIDEAWDIVKKREYRPAGALRLVETKGRHARVVADLERPKDASRYQAEFRLTREGEYAWRICQVRFFRL